MGHGLGSGMECLDAAVDALVAVDPGELPDVVLADELVALRARMDRLDAVFAGFAAAAHRRGVGTGDGASSTAAWLAQHAGMRTGDARAAIEAGEVATLLPEAGAAWRAGEVSTVAFRWIAGARVADHDDLLLACEPALLGLAKSEDLRSLRRAAAHFRNLARADSTPPGVHDGLYISKAYSGTHVLNAELSDLAAETMLTALHAYTDPPTYEDSRTPAKRRADALVRICGVALEHSGGRAPRSGPCERCHRLVHTHEREPRQARRRIHRSDPPSGHPAAPVRLQHEPGRHRAGQPPARCGPFDSKHPAGHPPRTRRS